MKIDSFVAEVRGKLSVVRRMLDRGDSTEEIDKVLEETYAFVSSPGSLVDGCGLMSLAELAGTMEQSGILELHVVRKENGQAR